MKLLVFSHPAVIPVNQQIFVEVEKLTGWDLTLVGPSNWIDDYGIVRCIKSTDNLKGKIVQIPVWPPASIPLHLYRSTLIFLLRAIQPHAIYVHNEPYAASTAQILAANQLSGIGASFGFYSAQNIEKSYPPPFRWTERWVHQKSSFAFPCSQTVLDTLRAKGYTGPASLLPLGIDPDTYQPNPDDSHVFTNLEYNEDILFGYVGRITEEKGLKTLFRALASLPNDLRWRLAILGNGPLEAELRSLGKNLGLADRIEWLGYVEHTKVPSYLAKFDALVIPSETQTNWKEQFGRVIIESLSCGTPVVGTDSGEIPHLLRRTGGGIIVRERDPEALAAGLVEIACHPEKRRHLAQSGGRYVRSHYNQKSLAQIFADSIASVHSSPNYAH
jgi:glycosyltransferase involved in cell wall biosynthesis